MGEILLSLTLILFVVVLFLVKRKEKSKQNNNKCNSDYKRKYYDWNHFYRPGYGIRRSEEPLNWIKNDCSSIRKKELMNSNYTTNKNEFSWFAEDVGEEEVREDEMKYNNKDNKDKDKDNKACFDIWGRSAPGVGKEKNEIKVINLEDYLQLNKSDSDEDEKINNVNEENIVNEDLIRLESQKKNINNQVVRLADILTF